MIENIHASHYRGCSTVVEGKRDGAKHLRERDPRNHPGDGDRHQEAATGQHAHLQRHGAIRSPEALAVTTKRFLTPLRRHAEQSYQSLPEELRERYSASESRLFGMGTKTTRPSEESIQEVAEDIARIIARFGEEEKMNGRTKPPRVRRE